MDKTEKIIDSLLEREDFDDIAWENPKPPPPPPPVDDPSWTGTEEERWEVWAEFRDAFEEVFGNAVDTAMYYCLTLGTNKVADDPQGVARMTMEYALEEDDIPRMVVDAMTAALEKILPKMAVALERNINFFSLRSDVTEQSFGDEVVKQLPQGWENTVG